jgi:ubiquinone/menaquinone biosynthesis C-methylase UbiE
MTIEALNSQCVQEVSLVMMSMPLFEIGRCEVSPAVEAVLAAAGLDPQPFFARHEHGDWGEAPDWLRGLNDRAAHLASYGHAIRSHYLLDGLGEIMVVTAMDRSRSRLLLADEFDDHEASVQEGYAVWAASYDRPNPLIEVEEPVVDAILAGLPPIASAIDVGAGTGRLARKLAHLGAGDVLCVDATPEMLVVARETARREGLHTLRFELATIGPGPLPAASDAFDLLTCGLMLCHVPDVRAAIRECVRVVRPGGWLLISDFHPETSAFGWRTDHVTPEAVYLLPNMRNTRADYLDALTESGCTLVDVRDLDFDGKPYGEVTEATIRERGFPPFCLVALAQKTGMRE